MLLKQSLFMMSLLSSLLIVSADEQVDKLDMSRLVISKPINHKNSCMVVNVISQEERSMDIINSCVTELAEYDILPEASSPLYEVSFQLNKRRVNSIDILAILHQKWLIIANDHHLSTQRINRELKRIAALRPDPEKIMYYSPKRMNAYTILKEHLEESAMRGLLTDEERHFVALNQIKELMEFMLSYNTNMQELNAKISD